jgi:L-lactate dehydrogenase complex protein LldF
VGIEKTIPSINDLGLFWPLLATYGTGQQITVYNSIITGPRQPGEVDGPEEMYVILLDNGRTELLSNAKAREALYCIRCGACLNACPVYKNIGGHAYDTTYSGPIGSVITPHLRGMHDYKHLSYASSLCGNCTEVCPVKINIHELLLENRRESVVAGESDFAEKFAWKMWKNASMSRLMMNQGNATIKNWVIHTTQYMILKTQFNVLLIVVELILIVNHANSGLIQPHQNVLLSLQTILKHTLRRHRI